MFDAMERGDLKALYVIGENPQTRRLTRTAPSKLLQGLTSWWCRTC
jgi:predicted molibdopterin-dependent oxidoreductase YjgC